MVIQGLSLEIVTNRDSFKRVKFWSIKKNKNYQKWIKAVLRKL